MACPSLPYLLWWYRGWHRRATRFLGRLQESAGRACVQSSGAVYLCGFRFVFGGHGGDFGGIFLESLGATKELPPILTNAVEWTPVERLCLHFGVIAPAPLTEVVRQHEQVLNNRSGHDRNTVP